MKQISELIILIAAAGALTSCNPVVYTQISQPHNPIANYEYVEVLYPETSIPEGAIRIGHTKVDESGFTTRCSFEFVVMKARIEGAKAGADFIKITEHKTPNLWSTCHRIAADLYILIDTPADSTSAPVVENDYGTDSLQEQPAAAAITKTPAKKQPWRLAISGGYSRRLAPVDDLGNQFLEDYLNELRNGYFFSAEFGVNVSGGINLGMRVDRMFSSNSALVDLIPDDPNEPVRSGLLKDDIKITFLGPQILFRSPSRNQVTEFMFGLSLGYLDYRDEGELVGEKITITGSTLGLRVDGGVDFKLHPNIALGINLGFSTGGLTKLKIETATGTTTLEAEPGEGESLLRLDLGGGIRFIF